MPTARNPDRPRFHYVFVIEAQSAYRCASGWSEPNHMYTTICPSEMIRPNLNARVKKKNPFAGRMIQSVRFRGFEFVAAVTCRSKIRTFIAATPRAGHNVVNH